MCWNRVNVVLEEETEESAASSDSLGNSRTLGNLLRFRDKRTSFVLFASLHLPANSANFLSFCTFQELQDTCLLWSVFSFDF